MSTSSATDDVEVKGTSPVVAPAAAGAAPVRRLIPSERAAAAAAQRSGDEAKKRPLANVNISTRHILKEFAASNSVSYDEEHAKALEDWQRRSRMARAAVHRLVNPSLKEKLFDMCRRYCYPSTSLKMYRDRTELEARDACRFYFSQRSSIPVYVCDFGQDSASRYITSVGEIEKYMDTKPDNVVVRWLHIPLGLGVLQSTIEELFNYSGSGHIGKAFTNAGYGSWPYLCNTQMLSFANHDNEAERISAWNVLSKLQILQEGPSEDALQHMSDRQRKDLSWRCAHVRTKLDFWGMAQSDIPTHLADRQIGRDLRRRRAVVGKDLRVPASQALSQHEKFKKTLMVIRELRVFHRSDGFLLSFCPEPGVDYLDAKFPEYLTQPKEILLDNPDASVFAHVSKTFLDSGTRRWHRKTVEWLVVYLATEATATPHGIRQGHNAASFIYAYQEIATDLKQQQKDPWRRGESVAMVRKYLDSLDELRVIQAVMNGKIGLMKRLLLDCERIEREWTEEGLDECTDENAEPISERVQWALALLNEKIEDINVLVEHFHTAMGELFQLRSIEQNELAIAADSQNKAILLFTGVTIVFLPLSFFTSYFGMNLQGLQNNDHDETYFWRLCGTIALLLVIVLLGIAFRSQISHQIWRRSPGLLHNRGFATRPLLR